MKVVVIEDETLVAKDLVKTIGRIDTEIEVAEVLSSVKEAVEYFRSQPEPDLIFADIQLSDGVSFDIFSQVATAAPIIFTTAYDEFAVKAFKLNSIDYLLKPIDETELKKAIIKFRELKNYGSREVFQNQIASLLKDLNAPQQKKYKTRFTGNLGKSLVAVPEDKVAFFTKDVLIFLVTHDGRHITTDYHSLEELDALIDPAKFFRANRQYIISIDAIDNVKSHFTGKLNIELKAPLKADITVSREKAGEFRRWFEGV